MTKAIRLVKRRLDVPLDAFVEEWRVAYALVLGAATEVRRCVHSYTRPAGYRTGEPAFDGVAELWFDDAASLARFSESDVARSCLAAEDPLIEHSRTVALTVEDVTVKDGPVPDGAAKIIVAVHPRPELERDEFHRYWRDVHGPIGARLPSLCRYVQSHASEPATAPDGRVVEGCALTWFPSTDAIRTSMDSEEWAALRADEPNLVEADCPFVVASEHVLIDRT